MFFNHLQFSHENFPCPSGILWVIFRKHFELFHTVFSTFVITLFVNDSITILHSLIQFVYIYFILSLKVSKCLQCFKHFYMLVINLTRKFSPNIFSFLTKFSMWIYKFCRDFRATIWIFHNFYLQILSP